jgi:hypothetical protein
MLINAALETGAGTRRSRADRQPAELTRAFRNAVEGGCQGELDRKTDTNALALALVSQSFGLNIMARNGATAATLEKVVDIALQPFK